MIMWHCKHYFKINPPNLHIMTYLYGDKIFLKKGNKKLDNIGAIFLYKNQKAHYLEYFLSLMTIWDYMPKDNQLNDLRNFIIKYYKDEMLLDIFDESVRLNKKWLGRK